MALDTLFKAVNRIKHIITNFPEITVSCGQFVYTTSHCYIIIAETMKVFT